MRWLAFAAVILLLAGCFGMCDLMPDNARWTDTRLFAAMPGEPTMFDWVDDTPGFPLEDSSLEVRWGNWSLVQVSWQPDGAVGRSARISASHDRGLHASYENASAFRAAADDFAAFVAGFAPAGGPDAETLMERMLANETDHGDGERAIAGSDARIVPLSEFRADLPPGWTPQPAWDALPGINASTSKAGAVGGATLQQGPWEFAFAIGVKQLQGDGYTLSADGAGNAFFEGLAMGEGEEAAYRQRVVAELEMLHLPAPDPDDLSVGGVVC